ncbi:MAG: tRNA (adenosine(37)-N6)-threonylcarbamoyltransferase complex transferase subunit TsaD [bacterium]|nr:tRNA (adenosine(37)-N6)-threonylcarbamoyltransferase complex transferase subunit TsaD [bacterium]
MRILAIESSCDENSAAVLADGAVCSLVTVTQKVHQAWGGVVPELAGRSHLELQDNVVAQALSRAGIGLDGIQLIAATCGPGLVGSLLVGYYFGAAVAAARNLPFVPVHHMEAHLWSPELDRTEPLPLPMLVLLVSGGHTQLVHVRAFRDYGILGSTRDDALGEAYDKVGKLVGLEFPAGAQIDKLAATGNPNAVAFPVAMRDASLDFSYSGLKTAVANKVRLEPDWVSPDRLPGLLASFQSAAIQSALEKVALALQRNPVKSLAAAGGVAANSLLRTGLSHIAAEHRIPLAVPALKYCADNAAMVGYVAHKHSALQSSVESYSVRPRWPLSELGPASSSRH